ncbi:MAG TPA: hypothetical protein VIL29_08470 [Pseudothermotoga sp.]
MAKTQPKDRRKSIAKGLDTKAKNQIAQARALREQAKGDYTLTGDKLRRQAKKLSEQAKRKKAKAKELRREIRAEKNKITVGEQRILDQQRTQKARETRLRNIDARRKAGQIPNFDTAFIDTVRELATRGRGSSVLNTSVAIAIRAWLNRTIATHGENLVAYVCEKALGNNPYIFDSYIYQSDQSGFLSNETLFILNEYANQYIEDYKSETYDETELGIDEDDGTGEIYY